MKFFHKTFKKISKKWMTLMELLLSLMIFGIIMVTVMASVQSMTASRIKSMNRIALTDELYFFSEQLFTIIKDGGTLDYEEYWNRQMVGTDLDENRTFYKKPTGFGNYGKSASFDPKSDSFSDGWKMYDCHSTQNERYDGEGCIISTLNTQWENQKWQYQRYGQYERQFWDINSDQKDFKKDDESDDKNLFKWPQAWKESPKELYLINSQNNTRTLIRWKRVQDPNASGKCDAKNLDNCLGTLQILRLKGLDRGMNHMGNTANDKTAYDGKIDTWVCEQGWKCQWLFFKSSGTLATGYDAEWINIFPNSINVRNFQIQAFPDKNPWLAAAEDDCATGDDSCKSPFVHPYIRLNLELGFSHGKRRTLKNENPTISIPVTINLEDFR